LGKGVTTVQGGLKVDTGGKQDGLPKEIADQIPDGHQATLSDGSVWKKVNGKAEKVK
jgi:hypothetical protein